MWLSYKNPKRSKREVLISVIAYAEKRTIAKRIQTNAKGNPSTSNWTKWTQLWNQTVPHTITILKILFKIVVAHSIQLFCFHFAGGGTIEADEKKTERFMFGFAFCLFRVYLSHRHIHTTRKNTEQNKQFNQLDKAFRECMVFRVLSTTVARSFLYDVKVNGWRT